MNEQRDNPRKLWVEINSLIIRCNLSISSGKIATVIPIPKAKNSKNVSDLRPMSLLPILGKIIEHIIHDQLMNNHQTYKLLARMQFGFRPGLSTVDAISDLTDDVGLFLNNRQLTIVTFINFKKAFHTLDHNILVKGLAKLNLHPLTLDWFKS